MPFTIHCPACQAKLNAPDNLAGKRVKCPKCQTPVSVPAAGPAATPAAAASAARPAPVASAAQPAPAPLTPVVVAPAATPAGPPARGRGSALVWLLVGAIGAGSLLLVGAVAVVVVLLVPAGAPAPAKGAVAAAGTTSAAPLPPPQPVEQAVAAAPAVSPAPAAAPPAAAAAQVEWVAYENADHGFTAVFPGGQPEPIDPLATIEDPKQRELAAAMLKEWTVLGRTHGGRKYTLTCAPLVLGGVPAAAYLDRMSAGLKMLHQGFSIEPVEKTAPVRDFVLKKEGAGKLLRVVVGQGHVFQLLIEGESGLAVGDPVAQEFFGKFQAAGVSVAAASPAPDSGSKNAQNKIDPAPADVPDNIDWRPFTGQQIPFTINFPAVTPESEDPLSLVVESNRQNVSSHWSRDGVVAESYSAQAGDRRYGVTAFRDPNRRQEGSIRFAGQMQTLLRSFAQDLFDDVRQRAIRSRQPPSKLAAVVTSSLALRGGGKAIVRQASLGNYGFVIRVEGPAQMEDLDPQVHKFLDSLQPPPDAAPLPLNVKPLPGQPQPK